MHPLFAPKHPWQMMPTRGQVARQYYRDQIPFGAPDSGYAVRGAYAGALSGLGSVEEFNKDSVASIIAKRNGFQISLANAQIERAKCDNWTAGDVVGAAAGVLTFGISTAAVAAGKVECILRWDGQIGWFKDRITEATAALPAAELRERQQAAAAAQQASAQQSSSAGSGIALTKFGKVGMPKWVPIAAGVGALGIVGYMLFMGKK